MPIVPVLAVLKEIPSAELLELPRVGAPDPKAATEGSVILLLDAIGFVEVPATAGAVSVAVPEVFPERET